jgi:hypothetical protein
MKVSAHHFPSNKKVILNSKWILKSNFKEGQTIISFYSDKFDDTNDIPTKIENYQRNFNYQRGLYKFVIDLIHDGICTISYIIFQLIFIYII